MRAFDPPPDRSRRRDCTRTAALVLLFLAGAGGASAADVHGASVAVSPYAGTTSWGDDLELRNRLLYGARLGIFPVPFLGVEGTWGASDTETSFTGSFDTHVEHIGIDLLANLRPRGVLNPYLLGGWAQLSYDSDADNTVIGSTEYLMSGWEAGGGLDVLLGHGDGFRADLRVDARAVVTDPVRWFPNSDTNDTSLLFSAGVRLAFSGRSRADADKDGVVDEKDRCAGTPAGVIVDDVGCPRDDDGDGVPNGPDVCANTPVGASVDARGCPSDTDHDGVYDGIDRCAATPVGVTVDASGCPVDVDHDGVADSIDRCANTPAGAVVDSTGCPLDSDGDGVYDGLDRCANTPTGRAVDEQGCPVEKTAAEHQLVETGMIQTSDIHFASGSAEIEPASEKVLDDIGRALAQWPDARIEISGHTDARGADEKNLLLSARRAQAVLVYLSAKFPSIRSQQYVVQGYGESKPIASNDTNEGRAQNRRVEFRVLNPEVLKR